MSENELLSEPTYDSILVLSFGGPENEQEVIPFLENVLRGKNVPRERLLEVAEHYYHFGGKSPINDQNRDLVAALRNELERDGPHLPVYWGNRNWHPLLADTLRKMRTDGRTRALAFVTSAYSSYSGCRQYREDIARAQAEIGTGAPEVRKLRAFFNHPAFVEVMTENVCRALSRFPEDRRPETSLLFTAHSIPLTMAASSDYQPQIEETARLIGESMGRGDWQLVYQSRSGPPQQPWLEPDVNDVLLQLASQGRRDIVLAPIGFTSDHMEVLYDLDTEARALCDQLGLNMVRAATAGVHPKFIAMIRELIRERVEHAERRAVGKYGPRPDECQANCCPAPARPVERRSTAP